MKYLLALGFFCTVISLRAQTFSREVWYDGKVILDTEDTLTGNIRFDLADNLLQLETGGVSKAYSARNVISFEIFDEVNGVKRQYYALPYHATSNYKVPVFFELLTQGDLTLLCREKLVTETLPMYGYNPYGYGYGLGRPGFHNTQNRVAFDFFYLVKDHQEDLKDFVRERKLRYNERDDLTKIVSYYNYLKGK